MATYIWNGLNFNEGTQPTQFMLDPENNLYLFEQNYLGFFPCTVDSSGNPQYSGNLQYAVAFIPAGIQFDQAFGYTQDQVYAVDTTILNGRLNIFQSNATNIVNASTQNTSSYVNTTVTTALSGAGIAQATSTAAPYLVSPQMNFTFQEILKNWVNGPTMIANLASLLSNHQSNIVGASASVQRITDFKKKLVRQQAVQANQVAIVQNNSSTCLASGTFGAMATAFPNELQPLIGVLQNHNSFTSQQLTNLLPTIATGAGSSIESVVSGIVSGLFGGNSSNVPSIINPIDKFVVDLNTISTSNNSLINQIGNSGFSSLPSQTNYVNQVVNLLNNVMSQIPVTSQTPAPTPVTNPTVINNTITSYYDSQLNLNQNAATSSSQAATNKLLALMQASGPSTTNQNNPTAPPTYVANNPVYGGSFINSGPLQSIFNGEEDQSVIAPNITLSPDPSIQTQQNNTNVAQNAANAAGVSRTPTQGAGINTLDEVPLRPRNTPVDGSLGDYDITLGIIV